MHVFIQTHRHTHVNKHKVTHANKIVYTETHTNIMCTHANTTHTMYMNVYEHIQMHRDTNTETHMNTETLRKHINTRSYTHTKLM